MGNLADYVMDCERNVKQEGLSQTLGWAFLHWRWYCDLRGWAVEYLIDETCQAFEDKHVRLAHWSPSLEPDSSEHQ